MARDLAALDLKFTEIRAPISGIVANRQVKIGNLVRELDAVFDIEDFDPLLAVIFVPETQLNIIRAGQPVDIEVDAYRGQVFEGEVDRIAPVIDPATGTFKVTVAVTDEQQRLRPGLFGRVRIVYDQRQAVPLVPAKAVISEDSERWVFVVREGKAHRTKVELGLSGQDSFEVISGLELGDRVVVSGQNSLREGNAVAVINDELDALEDTQRLAQRVAQNEQENP